jgi:hypothetical protein
VLNESIVVIQLFCINDLVNAQANLKVIVHFLSQSNKRCLTSEGSGNY